MSWHNSAILVHTDYSRELERLLAILGFANARRKPEWDTVFGDNSFCGKSGYIGATTANGWTCLLGAELSLVIQEKRISRLSEHVEFLAWELNSKDRVVIVLINGGKTARNVDIGKKRKETFSQTSVSRCFLTIASRRPMSIRKSARSLRWRDWGFRSSCYLKNP
jgi:hypothetical protein